MATKDLIIDSATNFYNKLKLDKNGRYLSWEHCYSKFYNARKIIVSDEYMDYLALQLAFYLASWGMYRGSSFLLQQDYKVHIPVVGELLKEKYNALQGIKCKELKKNLPLLGEIVSFIKDYYNAIRIRISENDPKNDLSDTLITKILMGTLGCVPAYDRYFIEGIKEERISTGIFNNNSVIRLIKFYEENEKEFDSILSAMFIGNIPYPQMKFLDMGFWKIGFEKDLNKGQKIAH